VVVAAGVVIVKVDGTMNTPVRPSSSQTARSRLERPNTSAPATHPNRRPEAAGCGTSPISPDKEIWGLLTVLVFRSYATAAAQAKA
jgi:hypothetical protein